MFKTLNFTPPNWWDQWEKYLAIQYRSSNTRYSYASRIRTWVRDGMPPLDEWVASSTERPSEHNQRRAASVRLLKFATRYKLSLGGASIEDMPRTTPQDIHPQVITLTELQVQQMLERVKHHTDENHHAFAVMCYALAARRSEIRNMKVCHLQLDHDFPHVEITGKGGKKRQVPLSPSALAFLRAYLKRMRLMKSIAMTGDDWLFAVQRRSGTRCRIETHFRAITKAIRLSIAEMVANGEVGEYALALMADPGFKPIHLLRNRRTTHLYQRGAGISELRAMGGWSGLASLQRYLDHSLEQVSKETAVDTSDLGTEQHLEILEDVA